MADVWERLGRLGLWVGGAHSSTVSIGLPVTGRRRSGVLAALGPKMVELARDRAAGAHPYLVTPDHTAFARQVLRPGPLLAPEQAVVMVDDAAIARKRARQYLTAYLRLPNDLSNLRRFLFDDDDFAGGGSDRLVDAVVPWGEAAATRVQEHFDAGADHVCVQPLGDGRAVDLDGFRALRSVFAC